MIGWNVSVFNIKCIAIGTTTLPKQSAYMGCLEMVILHSAYLYIAIHDSAERIYQVFDIKCIPIGTITIVPKQSAYPGCAEKVILHPACLYIAIHDSAEHIYPIRNIK